MVCTAPAAPRSSVPTPCTAVCVWPLQGWKNNLKVAWDLFDPWNSRMYVWLWRFLVPLMGSTQAADYVNAMNIIAAKAQELAQMMQ